MMMIDLTTKLGQRAKQRIETEYVIWLTTVDAKGIPQPRPVWFVWDGEAFIIYSQANAKKLQHMARNPNVSLHFDGGPKGEDIQVFLGRAERVENPLPTNKNRAYSEKYRGGIMELGMTEKVFAQEYSVQLRIQPARLRSF